jgi:hypothetical protein
MVTATEWRHAKEAREDQARENQAREDQAREDQATQDQSRQQSHAKEWRDNMIALRNVLFIACCVGQYDFAKSNHRGDVDLEAASTTTSTEERRNRALLLGLLLPLCDKKKPPPPAVLNILGESNHWESGRGRSDWFRQVELIKVLTPLLAHHLHLLRRRGMYPLTISIVWFMAAFATGIYQSFREVGDYTIAHSLAVGLLLSWLPILVLMSIADRNPNGVERCTVSCGFQMMTEY